MQLNDVVMCPTCRLQGKHSALFRIVPSNDFSVRFDPRDASVSVGCVKSVAAIEEQQQLDVSAEARTNRCLAIISELVSSCQSLSSSSEMHHGCCTDIDEFVALECNCEIKIMVLLYNQDY